MKTRIIATTVLVLFLLAIPTAAWAKPCTTTTTIKPTSTTVAPKVLAKLEVPSTTTTTALPTATTTVPATVPATVPTAPQELARTGINVGLIALLGAILLLVGMTIYSIRQRV